MSDIDQGQLNLQGINVVRVFGKRRPPDPVGRADDGHRHATGST